MAVKLLELEPQRRDAVLNAALKEFALRGYDHASTNVIAREAGISKALMFHYVNNKQDLFLCVYDYFAELLDREYFKQMDFVEKDIFSRLRQSYILQIKLLKQYPWISEFSKITVLTGSAKLNEELEKREDKKRSDCYIQIFDAIDESRFKKGLNIERCKQIIFWANVGFADKLLDDVRNAGNGSFDCEKIVKEIDGYFAELRKIFYDSEDRSRD